MGPEASHHLVHIVADDKFEKKLRFATKWAAGEFVKQALISEEQKLVSLLKLCDGGLKDLLYETIMHAKLAMGGKFNVVPLHPKTLERGNEEKLVIQACKKVRCFKDDISGMNRARSVYLKSISSTFPVIDAVRVPELYLFQMSISATKEINADDLENMFERLGIPASGQEGPNPSLYFVVHPDFYNTFKVQAAMKKWKSGQSDKVGKAAWPPNPKQVRVAIGAINMGPEASHRLVHIVADNELQKQHLKFASKWVAGEFVKRALISEEQKLVSVLQSCDGGLKGLLYEAVMHAKLARGGTFDVVKLHSKDFEEGQGGGAGY
ncbi:hypothetical protein VOLCADRAFT_91833 [Volvox carteri f. nagariensis]|uniref:Uncharacterized protein n=1 Tax=Volvox carteri f. nagariensis TaxID=3068 RepID=D8TY28_VOLCA|nr:uncharacterized protein VOLCADRAFT_91833 [Volvox carteri f. nagariensis]EFJ47478.1 hypothetical protein VOLCADRAFT_91833 [Volvox carteri f. nagariensis]|eukprot:XP_002951302.1 hypothetical protein VOLCADRAFT_91833 [Volvox carteri f. nagariensis]